MPELPEVETLRRDLEVALAGATVTGVEVTGLRSTRRHRDAAAFAEALSGRRLESFRRRGKYLLVGLGTGPDGLGPGPDGLRRGPDGLAPGAADPGGACPGRVDGPAVVRAPPDVLVVHLRMSGQLRLAASADEPRARHSHVVLGLADGREVRFVDPRTFGELFVTTSAVPELAGLGIDALDPGLTSDVLAGLLRRRRARMKPLLLDQRVVAGIGNIYSDEILWAARLRWCRRADGLRPAEVRRLHDAMHAVLAQAVQDRGSSLSDAQYVDLAGRGGTYQRRHAVYAREGLPCPRCGRSIERTAVAQRSHFWCRRCQR